MRRTRCATAVAVLATLLSGCKRASSALDAGARVPDAGTRGPQGDGGRDAAIAFVEHVLADGETLWDVAQAYGVSVAELMRFNGLGPRDVRRMRRGRVLRVPGRTERVPVATAVDRAAAREQARRSLPPVDDGAYHFLAPGQTLWDVARLYDVPLSDLVARNELDDEEARSLAPGTPVVVPGIRPSQVRDETPVAPRGFLHTVGPGETIWDLSRTFHVSVGEIMAANDLDAESARSLTAGMRLRIPASRAVRPRQDLSRWTRAQKKALALARRIGLLDRTAGRELLRGRVRPHWIRHAGPLRQWPGTLRWPVDRGRYVRGWGSGEGGYHLAVDIAGELGSTVRAAAPGIVGYAGDDIEGFGNMVMLIHPGGWVTLYAHNSVNFVVPGQRVPRGAPIAEVGSTGISRGPHVHFELIFEGKNCDPALLFRPGVMHRGGRTSRLRYTEWRDPRRPPEAMRCAPRRRHPRSQWVIHEDPTADAEPEPTEGASETPR
ncbi:MAG: LysM peptidoglycan-binding domain-containing protein [Myxococcota bacterium]|nr:LysM peptidoglycan-binding domain-containing protein [Myxococcota bacterium]MDW8363343.1 LysM peptidoglycan-binding domain-containing protein [Myxococcales bacterium]